MNGTQIHTKALRKTDTNIADYGTDKADIDLNDRHLYICDKIINEVDEGFFWDTGIEDLTINQSEYVADRLGISPDDLEIGKINKVFVKYDSNDQFKTRLRFQNPGDLEKDLEWYKINQPRSDAFFFIRDKSIFIYPTPAEAVLSGLEIHVSHRPSEISTSTSEEDIGLSATYHNLLVLGLQIDILESQGKYDKSQIKESQFFRDVDEMVSSLKWRYNQPLESVIPNISHLS